MPRRTSASRKKRAEAAGTCERKFSSFITTTVAPDVRLWQEARTTPPLEARISHVRTRLHPPAAPEPDGGRCTRGGNRGPGLRARLHRPYGVDPLHRGEGLARRPGYAARPAVPPHRPPGAPFRSEPLTG